MLSLLCLALTVLLLLALAWTDPEFAARAPLLALAGAIGILAVWAFTGPRVDRTSVDYPGRREKESYYLRPGAEHVLHGDWVFIRGASGILSPTSMERGSFSKRSWERLERSLERV
ncbi:hypothetical protein [Salininema proteolyticum]|uniref:Uncharacterized protein n=1 Tax=Salininema proteolyticum TaxID=1607685 RepID=A0ABV8TWS0_9ACTN